MAFKYGVIRWPLFLFQRECLALCSWGSQNVELDKAVIQYLSHFYERQNCMTLFKTLMARHLHYVQYNGTRMFLISSLIVKPMLIIFGRLLLKETDNKAIQEQRATFVAVRILPSIMVTSLLICGLECRRLTQCYILVQNKRNDTIIQQCSRW